ncbi:MAG: hypothetical protein ACKVY0_29565 [Prosthecobacter sp.]|uniref:hypothetical protein n=1 Tax=Prosthecobacter sp. TaxID=1965333 RepID=UPI0039038AB8
MTKSELKRGVTWGAGATLLFLSLNTALLVVSPAQYVSRAQIRLTGYDRHPSPMSDVGAVQFQLIEDFSDSFLTDSMISAVRAKLGQPAVSDVQIKNQLRATPMVGSAYVLVTASNEKPEEAQKIVRTALDARASLYDALVLQRLAEKTAAINTVELTVRTELDAVSARLSESKRGTDYAGSIRAVDLALAEVICERAKVEATLESLSTMSKTNVLGEIIDEPSDVAFLQSAKTLRKWGVVELRQELATSRSELAGLLRNLGEENPKTKIAKARVNAVENELKSFLTLQSEKERSTLNALKRGEQELRESRAEYEKAIHSDRAKELADGAQQAVKSGLEAALAQIVQSRQLVDLARSSTSPLFIIEVPPTLPSEKELPHTRLAFLTCPLLGAIIGLLGAGPKQETR